MDWPRRHPLLQSLQLDVLEVKVDTRRHVTAQCDRLIAEVQPLLERAAGRIPARRPDQSAAERKLEIDQVLPGLREERKRLVEEERQEKAAKRARES